MESQDNVNWIPDLHLDSINGKSRPSLTSFLLLFFYLRELLFLRHFKFSLLRWNCFLFPLQNMEEWRRAHILCLGFSFLGWGLVASKSVT
jgi:hypothetical protein